MDVFKLLGTIAINGDDAKKELDDVTGKAKDSESKFSGALSKMGNAAVKVGKTVAVGIGAASTAVAGLVTASTKAYADYEQLVGGVETLFASQYSTVEEYAEAVGESVENVRESFEAEMGAIDKVLANADKAYETAGMSANEYMETVTSFSASLLQSLGGNVALAADVADRAITDMSDNANKMGTDIGMIQNAYNGFAKQNYTINLMSVA